jgi:hypothetical protein
MARGNLIKQNTDWEQGQDNNSYRQVHLQNFEISQLQLIPTFLLIKWLISNNYILIRFSSGFRTAQLCHARKLQKLWSLRRRKKGETEEISPMILGDIMIWLFLPHVFYSWQICWIKTVIPSWALRRKTYNIVVCTM